MKKTSNSEYIRIKGANLHNLKNVSVDIPKNKLVVITGLSGSGKSTLAFDTLYAEGQRRYVESLSSYARQFLGKLKKPDIKSIEGIAPAIAIEQKVNSKNPRSTVGTSTEIYDYLKLLYARIGNTISPISNRKVKRHSIEDVVNYILENKEDTPIYILSKIDYKSKNDLKEKLSILSKQGFARILVNDIIFKINSLIEKKTNSECYLVIDRLKVKNSSVFKNRIYDSIGTAFHEGRNECIIYKLNEKKKINFSNKFELDGLKFIKPTSNFFSFNNPLGACPHCEGYGSSIDIDENLVIPNMKLSVYEDAIVCWKGEKLSKWKKKFINASHKFNFPIHKPYKKLNKEEKEAIWNGNEFCKGINQFFSFIESKSYKIQYRVLLARYKGKTKCKKCNGNRLRKETNYVKIKNITITDIINLPIEELQLFFKKLKLKKHEKKIAERILVEINSRLQYLLDVGLGYLTLNRHSSTLSGGESQRINLATSLGSSLVGSVYILDEPSIGLHASDTQRLINVLHSLRDLGNTVIVVEHDEQIIKKSDYIIDLGKEAGVNGGEIIFNGTYRNLIKSKESYTSLYLNNKINITTLKKRTIGTDKIKIKGAFENNLKSIDVSIPLRCLTVVTGVSGSGKSSLIEKTLYPALLNKLGIYSKKPGKFISISGENHIDKIEFVNQNPIGKSSRSNPSTYLKIYDDIRYLFANTKLSLLQKYKPKHFSFNVTGGRCENCKGEGKVKIEMQFMADVDLECETCNGRRFKKEILEVKVHKKNIHDILNMSIIEAFNFFTSINQNKLAKKLIPLIDVGLDYIKLGQSSSTLSGGEAQRVKLAYFLSKSTNNTNTLFIFDEPTTGLHFHDVNKLVKSFEALLNLGNSIIVIEHNLEIIKCADYIVDLGPKGGEKGGNIVFSGPAKEIRNNKKSLTASFLKDKL